MPLPANYSVSKCALSHHCGTNNLPLINNGHQLPPPWSEIAVLGKEKTLEIFGGLGSIG